MGKIGNVQQKISCVFETKVVEETSSKRAHQSYKVVACDRLRNPELISTAVASEKVDGTCTYISKFEEKPWLWARLDRKPNKAADKKFKKFQTTHRAWQVTGSPDVPEPKFQWDVDRDFKDIPPNWIPATDIPKVDNKPQPDDLGHIPGWVPVDPTSRQHLWHLSSVDLVNGIALVLRPFSDNLDNTLEIAAVPLGDLCGATMELIGTNVNGNPYKIGNKENPIHFLVRHGSITFQKSPPTVFEDLQLWFEKDPEGQVEGIVWHCSNSKLFKLHRHHIGLKWPVEDLKLNSCKIKINVDMDNHENAFQQSNLFKKLYENNGIVLTSLQDLSNL